MPPGPTQTRPRFSGRTGVEMPALLLMVWVPFGKHDSMMSRQPVVAGWNVIVPMTSTSPPDIGSNTVAIVPSHGPGAMGTWAGTWLLWQLQPLAR